MGLVLITPPAGEPLSLAEAKSHLRVADARDDGDVIDLITETRERAELEVAGVIPAATWKETFDGFPEWALRLSKWPLFAVSGITYLDADGDSQTLASSAYRVSTGRHPALIEPAYGETWPTTYDVIDAVQVTYVCGYACTTVAAAIAAGEQTVTPASMAAIGVGTVLTIDAGPDRERVVVTAVAATTFTATFARAHAAGAWVCAVPATIRRAMKLMIGHWFRQREESIAGTIIAEIPLGAKALLMGNWHGGYP